ncbi:FadR/GntR family transcriptional regulator [Rhodococcus maanshanensis]|uniref:DNA-binding transcriptional regulator, FadR family n=1 Tax=Rhodococcus maanshanensis TaxID=183556 RepID=A0A1H7JHL2_9NOCA|nr:FCD domain-containing protein [Rhodococcus maanshanensis]SEK73962.1 DNA-binding transcriptional regulator, FadR family [Rhodococcus maanshanensis]
MVATPRRNLLADQTADLLLARLGAGEWAVGAKLPGETTLAAELGVGRSTVREALRMLAGQGLLRSRQGAGVFVERTEPLAADGWDGVLRAEAIAAVVEVRNAIEVEAARLAAQRATARDVTAMRRALDRRAAAVTSDHHAFVEADIAVHRAVVAAAHNRVLSELFETFVPRLTEALVEMIELLGLRETDKEPDADEHLALVEAIAAGDEEAAVRVSRAHLGAMLAAVRTPG